MGVAVGPPPMQPPPRPPPHLAALKVSPPIEAQAATRRDNALLYWEERNRAGKCLQRSTGIYAWNHRRVCAYRARYYPTGVFRFVFQFVLSAYFSLSVVCVNQQLPAPCSHYHLLGAAYSGENNCRTLKATLRIFLP